MIVHDLFVARIDDGLVCLLNGGVSPHRAFQGVAVSTRMTVCPAQVVFRELAIRLIIKSISLRIGGLLELVWLLPVD